MRTKREQRVNGDRQSPPALQRQIPVLADDILAEVAHRLAGPQAKARALIDMPRRREHAVGPQRDALISALAGEADTLLRQSGAKAAPARHRLDQQQA